MSKHYHPIIGEYEVLPTWDAHHMAMENWSKLSNEQRAAILADPDWNASAREELESCEAKLQAERAANG